MVPQMELASPFSLGEGPSQPMSFALPIASGFQTLAPRLPQRPCKAAFPPLAAAAAADWLSLSQMSLVQCCPAGPVAARTSLLVLVKASFLNADGRCSSGDKHSKRSLSCCLEETVWMEDLIIWISL